MEIRHNIYDQLLQDERISLTSISKNLGLARNTVTSHYNHMLKRKILFPPSLRLKMFEDLREYIYFLALEKPMRVFQELENHPRVIYHCLTSGAFDMVVFTDSPIDFESHPNFRQYILGGARGDYFFNHVSRITYAEAVQRIKEKLNQNSEHSTINMEFEPRAVKWTQLEWGLYHDLKYNMRRTFTEIVKKHKISKWLFYQSFDHIKENCIVTVPFYPKRAPNYSDFYITLKTEYEKLLSDIFAEIPCAGVTFKVEDHLVAWVNILQTFDFSKIFGILQWMEDHGILEDMIYAFPIYCHRRG